MAAPKGNKHALGNKGGGRKSSYQAKYAEMAKKACEAGFTDKEIGDLFGVCETTINKWKLDFVEFREALKAGKDVPDDRVERSLYHKAIGYSFDSEKIFQFQGDIVRAKSLEHVPPDTTACIFWLKNRRKDVWRDRHEHELGGLNGGPVRFVVESAPVAADDQA